MPWWATGQDVMPTGEETILKQQEFMPMVSETGDAHPLAYSLYPPFSAPGLACPNRPFQAYVLSQDPLMIYLENFVSEQEATYLVDQAYVCYIDSSPRRLRRCQQRRILAICRRTAQGRGETWEERARRAQRGTVITERVLETRSHHCLYRSASGGVSKHTEDTARSSSSRTLWCIRLLQAASRLVR